VTGRTGVGPRPARADWLRWTALTATALAVVTVAVLGSRFGSDPGIVRSPLVGRPAPEARLPYLDRAGSLSLSELRGQVVVVNFWASWCVPCRTEHPALLAAADQFRDAGVRFVGIVYQDRSEAATAFLDELGRGVGYAYLTDPGSRTALDFGLFGIPETFFIDRRGIVVAKITGESTAALLSDTLTEILAGRTPQSRRTGVVQSR
jgi:cytochrome c biogenesis protein CcmG, thiol:disulfide interchange protein DsbE